MPQPTTRTLLLLAASLPLSFAPVVLGPASWVLGAAAVAALLIAWLADLWKSAGARDWRVEAEVPPTLFIGDADPLPISVALARPEGARDVRLRVDLGARFAPVESVALALDVNGGQSLTVPLAPYGRGLGSVDELWLEWEGPLRLVRRTLRVEIGRNVAIVPNLRAVHAAALKLGRAASSFSGRKPERFHGDGSEFESLREFEPGFDARTLDWKASARHLRLLSREFRAERNHHLVLALDCGQRMREPIDGVARLDRSINAALMLAFVGLKHGDQVGLFAFDATPRLYEPPLAGLNSFGRLRRRSAELEASTEATNFTLGLTDLIGRLRRRALVILFTDFADSIGAELLVENVARLARRHVVLFVAVRDGELERIARAAPATERDLHRAVVAHDLLHDRALVLQQVARLGVHVLDARADEVSSKLVNRYLEIQRRELVA
jgi:uncharacterized protein (DUF58 family)